MGQLNLFGKSEADILNDYFLFFKKKGFPHYVKSEYNPKKQLIKLINFQENNIFKNNTIKQTMHGCGFLWSYFPHWVNVKYKNNKSTIIELWNNDKKLKELIKKTFDYCNKYEGGKITTNRLRQNAKVYLSKQTVSNFRPTAAKYIYNTYGNGGNVFDMSAGWGGRLFGFLASNCQSYTATEPSVKTFKGLQQIKNDFNYINKSINLHCLGSEVYKPKKEFFDLCFTSPPYFDTEKYSNEKTQSFIKYNTLGAWLNGFLNTTIKNCFYGLKNNGYLIVNIANTPNNKTLESGFLQIAKNNNFKFIKQINLELSSISGKGAKYEPIFILKKTIY